MDFKEIIIQIRAILNISQQELAKILGVSFVTINRWENGKTIPSKKHCKILENMLKECTNRGVYTNGQAD